MRIKRLTASFGKLENETLAFHDGLNVIYAPNESGKSTWCAFIMAMLYGIDSSERSRAGHMADKQKYAPWSGAPMEGTMEIRANHTNITLTRSTRSKNAPMREFNAFYTGTSTPVEELNGANAGEMLTGISKDVFRRSAFISQGTMAIDSNTELEKRINAIVSTGEEQVSYSEADARLREWQHKRRYNRRGFLPELEASMDEAKLKLDSLQKGAENLETLENNLAAKKDAIAELERQVSDQRRVQRQDTLKQLKDGRGELRSCSDAHDAALSELADRKRELRGSVLGMLSEEDAAAEVKADLNTCEDLNAGLRRKASPLAAVLCFILAVAAAAVYSRTSELIFVICSALTGILAVILTIRFFRSRNSVQEFAEKRKRILRKYHASDENGIVNAFDEYTALIASVRESEAREEELRARYEEAEERLSLLEQQAMDSLDFHSGSSEASLLSRRLNEYRSEAVKLSSEIAALRGGMAVSGDPLVLESGISSMSEQYDAIQNEYDAISLAIDTLRSADAMMQARFSPALGRVAAEYMSIVTGGRYSDILINRDFSARIRAADDTVARESDYLSKGTLDMMYIAVRLAVCELALPEGETCPLIIDDAFVNLDQDRFNQAMELLKEIAKSRQVILFTCRR